MTEKEQSVKGSIEGSAKIPRLEAKLENLILSEMEIESPRHTASER